MQTIKQIADYLGVSKTTVRNRLTELELLPETEKNDRGVITIPDHVCKVVIDSFKKAEQQTTKSAEPEPESEQPQPLDANALLIDALQQRITAQAELINDLKDVISRLQNTIDNLSFALNNAQALTAGTLQTFQQLKAEHTDTASTPDAEIQHKPQPEQAEAEPAQQAAEPQQAEPQQPQQAADTSDSTSQPPRKPTSNAIKQSSTNNSTAQKSRVQPLRALHSLFKRNR